MAEVNKHDGVFIANTNKGSAPNPASIGPNKPRADEGGQSVGQRPGGETLGPGWSGNPKVPAPRGPMVTDPEMNRPGPDDVNITPVTNPAWREVSR